MTEERAFLIKTLRHVIGGGAITYEELIGEIPGPSRLPAKAEFDSWFALSYWSDDVDIREEDPSYGPMRLRQLQKLLVQLTSQAE